MGRAGHPDVLENCGLVQSRKTGRVRTYEIAPQPLKDAEQWIVTQRANRERRLDQLVLFLDDLNEEKG